MRATFDPHVQLTGTGSAVGRRVVMNDELEGMVHGYDKAKSGPFGAWVDQVTHIHERPYAEPGTSICDIALEAARGALEMAGLTAKDLGLIVYASFSMSRTIPGDHAVLAHRLGASRCPNFNLMGACAGSIYGLGLAYGMVASGAVRHVLVMGAENMIPYTNYHDPLTAILFGDGAGAAILSRVEGAPAGTGMLPPHLSFEYSPTAIVLSNSNNPHEMHCYPPAQGRPALGLVERSVIEMNGGASVLRAAINNMAECTVRTLGYEMSDLKAGTPGLREALDSAWLVPHQANGRILDGLSDKLGIPASRTIRTIYRYGNMSAASSLIALDHGMRRGNMDRVFDDQGKVIEVRDTPDRIRRGDLVMLPSIGGGYLMACVGLRSPYVGA